MRLLKKILPFLSVLLLLEPTLAQPPKKEAIKSPLAPKDAQKLFQLPPGLRIELVACEPQIESPVAMAFDEHGKLWVVEMRDYPNGPGKGEKPAGRIRVLEDKDGDGFYETSTIFADNLLYANGILPWKGGVIVTAAPHIMYLKDTKGTGKADHKEIWYEGFSTQNPQLRVSHPILGLDGWIYCANGLRGGKVIRAGKADAKPVDLSGMDFRFDPLNLDKYEAISGLGQYGNTFDDWGNRFVCDNRHHLRHIVIENRYLKRNPYLAAPALVQDVSELDDGPLNSGGKIYPISSNWTTSNLHEGRFTAACSVYIYRETLLPKFYQGAAFTCDPTGNLVHMETLQQKGATFKSRPAFKEKEFLASPDDWFRPVFLSSGPDGAMYVVDMYRAVIEHPDFMPPELKKRPDLNLGKDKGRIWRIVPDHHVTKKPSSSLAQASLADLVKTLEHEQSWQRTTAQRLLLVKDNKALTEPLTKLLETTKSPHAKILSAWTLDRQGKMYAGRIEQMLRDPHPRVREHAIRIVEPRLEKSGIVPPGWVAELRNDPDARVRFQVALSLGGFDHLALSLAEIAWKNRADRWTRLAVQSAVPKLAAQILLEFPDSTGGAAATEVSTQIMTREFAALTAAFAWPGGLWYDLQRIKNLAGPLELYFFAGLADGMARRGKTLLTSADELKGDERISYLQRISTVFSRAAKEAHDVKQSTGARRTGVHILSHATWPTAKQALLPLVEKETNVEVRIAALRALASQQDKEVPTLLMKLWRGAAPSVRREIAEAMLHKPQRVNVLLDEIEAKRLRASEIDALRTRQLVNHKNADIQKRARKLLAENIPADRKDVLARYQKALDLKGDAKNGLEIFKKNCATCHRVAGIGTDVGPDISDTRTKTPSGLLVDILNPNQAIDNNYVNYAVVTKSGKTLTGIITAETASSITLKRAEGQGDVVLRQDIDEIQSSGVSLMPDGLEKTINLQEMADVISFLKNWRYLDGKTPINR